jgi:AcrR family transcriptional regulator
MAERAGVVAEADQSASTGDGTTERAPASKKGDRTRERIKSAFSHLLDGKSFASVTIADICQTSDITVGGFYFHFGSQEELLDEVMVEHLARLVADVEAALAGAEGDAVAAAVCGAFVSAYSERSGLARTFQRLTRMRADYAARWRQASASTIVQLGGKLEAERPELAPQRTRFLAYALITMIVSKLDQVYVYKDHIGDRRGGRAGDLERNLVTTWLRMVAGPDAS